MIFHGQIFSFKNGTYPTLEKQRLIRKIGFIYNLIRRLPFYFGLQYGNAQEREMRIENDYYFKDIDHHTTNNDFHCYWSN